MSGIFELWHVGGFLAIAAGGLTMSRLRWIFFFVFAVKSFSQVFALFFPQILKGRRNEIWLQRLNVYQIL